MKEANPTKLTTPKKEVKEVNSIKELTSKK
jgi:hypothetical protein